MKKSKLKVSICSEFLIIISVLLFSLETNAKSANSHLDSLEVVRDSLVPCDYEIQDLLSLLREQTTAKVATTTAKVVSITTTAESTRRRRQQLPEIQHVPTRSLQRITKPHRPTLPHLPTRHHTTTTAIPPNDWVDNVQASLTNIDKIVKIFNNDLENETNADLLTNETKVLQSLDNNPNFNEVKQIEINDLIVRATSTLDDVEKVESDVNDEYDKYDKQKKVTISLSTLGAAIVLSLVIVMIVIYMKKNNRKDNSSDKSSSSGGDDSSLDGKENPEAPTDLYLSSQERFGIPRVKSSYVKDGQPSAQPSTSHESSSSSSKRESEKPAQIRY